LAHVSEAIRQGDIPGVQLRYRKRLAAPAERVWSWLTREERQAVWLGAEAAREGAVLTLIGGAAGEGERLVTHEMVEGRRWVVALERMGAGWEVATPVVIELLPCEEGLELMVFQSGFQRLKLSIGLTEWERYRRRWREAFDRLERALADPSG
jgi:uncharacterized protein YndB with AHSA1/START domain